MDTRSIVMGAAGAVVAVAALGGAYYLGHGSNPPPSTAVDQPATTPASADQTSPQTASTASPTPAPSWPGSRESRPHRVRRVDIGYFRSELSPYGRWQHDDRWGDVWQPTDAGPDFHPYRDGHWTYTDEFGWTWISNRQWGDVVFHYGRWVNDPDRGWLWVPGYVWGPGWVVWRAGAGHAGWMPMPPDRAFMDRDESYRGDWSDASNDDYGYRDWYGDRASEGRAASLWVYVDLDHLTDPDYRRYAVTRPDEVRRLNTQTRDVTHITTDGSYVANRSLNPQQMAQQGGRPVRTVPAADVIRHPDLVTPVAAGRQAAAEMRRHAPAGQAPAASPASPVPNANPPAAKPAAPAQPPVAPPKPGPQSAPSPHANMPAEKPHAPPAPAVQIPAKPVEHAQPPSAREANPPVHPPADHRPAHLPAAQPPQAAAPTVPSAHKPKALEHTGPLPAAPTDNKPRAGRSETPPPPVHEQKAPDRVLPTPPPPAHEKKLPGQVVPTTPPPPHEKKLPDQGMPNTPPPVREKKLPDRIVPNTPPPAAKPAPTPHAEERGTAQDAHAPLAGVKPPPPEKGQDEKHHPKKDGPPDQH